MHRRNGVLQHNNNRLNINLVVAFYAKQQTRFELHNNDIFSQDEATTEQRQASVNIRRKCQIWSASAETFSEEDHRAIALLLVAQTEAYLSFKDVASDLKAEAKTALAQAQITLRDEKANLQAFIATSLLLNKTLKSLSRLPWATSSQECDLNNWNVTISNTLKS